VNRAPRARPNAAAAAPVAVAANRRPAGRTAGAAVAIAAVAIAANRRPAGRAATALVAVAAKRRPAFWSHATAVIDRGARLGAGTKVWHFTHVMAGAQIGADCVLGQNVFVAATAVIGSGCRIQNNVSVYDGVVLGDDVFVGPSAVFTNVTRPRAAVSRKHAYAPTRIGRGATIGANATILCGISLGDYAFVAAGAVVTRDIPAHALVAGVPARRIGWACRCGETLPRALACAACGLRYARAGAAIIPR
jgi:UDP-2-acetamido-3-amino-2,3-dideoxy-glucuronate N-acetyltransferase